MKFINNFHGIRNQQQEVSDDLSDDVLNLEFVEPFLKVTSSGEVSCNALSWQEF